MSCERRNRSGVSFQGYRPAVTGPWVRWTCVVFRNRASGLRDVYLEGASGTRQAYLASEKRPGSAGLDLQNVVGVEDPALYPAERNLTTEVLLE